MNLLGQLQEHHQCISELNGEECHTSGELNPEQHDHEICHMNQQHCWPQRLVEVQQNTSRASEKPAVVGLFS